jgi:hypothetical protein
VTSIGYEAFYDCRSLTEITIPSKVTSIDRWAFGACGELADIYCFAPKVPETHKEAFYNSYPEYITLHVPASSVNAYKSQEPWKNFKNIVKIDMPEYTLTYMVDGDVYKTYQVEEGSSITPEPAPTKEGYTFSGWSEIPETMPAHDVTVTGTFAVSQYAITYIIDDEVYTTQTVDYGSIIVPPAAPERDGYDFAWGDYPETMPAYDIIIYGTYTTGIETIMAGVANCQIFSLDSKTLNEPQKGVNIVRMSNGQVRKVVVK